MPASPQTTVAAPLLRARNVSKVYGGEHALENVAIDFEGGQILALVGHNGSGKSTLVKTLTGFHDPEPGAEFEVEGRPASIGKTSIETASGDLPVHVVYQDGGLVLGLSAVDNMALMTGFERSAVGTVDWRGQRRAVREALALVQAEGVDIDRPVGELKMIERAQVAIARAVSGWDEDGGLLLLDEPTSALTDHEVEHLFEIIRSLRSPKVSIVYVSHRLEEVLRLADRIVVLRDGHVVADRAADTVDYDNLVHLMVGDPESAVPEAKAARRPAEAVDQEPSGEGPALSVRSFRSGSIADLSFTLGHGEILGVTGLAGSGHEEIPYLLVGAEKPEGGTLTIGGEELAASAMTPRRAVEMGLALVPADRLRDGLVAEFDVGDNISLPRLSAFASRGFLRPRRERAYVGEWLERLGVEPAVPDMPVLALSGGNQQKVVMGKSLGVARTALLLAEPTAGVDVGARATIYDRLRAEASRGLGILVCSSDTEDLVEVCDRVLVLRRGEVVGELTRADVTEASILHASGRDRT
jgi:ABC-type sugar transport system ATPase subunit